MTGRKTIHDEVVVVYDARLRRRVMLVLPVIREDAPARIREGIARRRTAATTGTCPCGANADLQRAGAVVTHMVGCPAVTETLTKAIRRWAQ